MSNSAINWIGRAEALVFKVDNFVDGVFRPGTADRFIRKYAPRDGRLLGEFAAAEKSDVEAAVASGRRAFADGRWSKLPVRQRSDVLLKLASLIEARTEELALLESIDVGKPIGETLRFDIPAAAATIRFSAEAADKMYGRVYGADSTSLSYELRRPIGVVAGIIGWNFPLVLAAQKIGPVLATGNSIVLKPSELTSLSVCRLAELAIEAGVPEGVFNVAHGDGATGSALAHHPDVNLLTFTGSSRTGKALMVAAGQSNMKRLILECGGKAPNIVFDDCPSLNAVADAIVASAFWNQGQVCVASSRLLLQEEVKDDLLRMVINKAAALSLGDPLRIATKFGALVSQGHQQRVLSYIEKGRQEGAHVAYRSDSPPPFERGFYVPPIIFDRVMSEQTIAQEEIFGPVLSVISFRDEKEAIEIANRTIYGLSAIVWTRDMGRAHRMSQAVDAGWIVVNTGEKTGGGPGHGVLATGGHKESGLGVEGGIEGLEAYTSKTAVQLFV